jgi:glycerol uptake facilitator-like aquaporin
MLEFRKFSFRSRLTGAECRPGATARKTAMHSVWLGEFAGTLVLVLLGTGVNAGVLLRKSYAADAGWMVIATGWALAVLCGVLVSQAFGSSAAHLNPAITFAAAINSGDFSQLLYFWSAQMLGAMAGAILMARIGRRHPTPPQNWACSVPTPRCIVHSSTCSAR